MNAINADDIVETLRTSLLVLDRDLRVQSANRAFFRTFGVEPADTIDRPLFELGHGQWDIPALREVLTTIIPEDRAIEAFEVEHEFPGIGRKVMLLNARKVYRPGNATERLLLTIDDVTEARDAQRESERNRLLAQSIVDTVRDPLVILEHDMRVVSASRAFLRLFNVPAEAVIGLPVQELAQGQWQIGKLQELLARVVPNNESFDGFEVEDEFPGLGRRIFKLNARKVHRPGNNATRLLLVFEDVTEARLLERHRDLLAAELAHRIKNSLTIITAFVSFEIRRAAEPCVQGYRAMQARISAVAQLYDVISRSASLGPVPMVPYLNGIAESLRASLLGDSSQIEVSVAAEPLAIGPDHAVTVGLIVNELATNAVKYAFPNGKGQIVLGFDRRNGDVALTVSDNGAGLGSAGNGPTGSGLGSRFVEAFVRQVGGTLATATGHSGTTFTVHLPVSILAEA
ncbi:PAS domain-containing protein [Methylobacterium sp. NEAU 140]|uniref:sensor histidine kinase n=1 Tax=Methylobacterium sp. NEAU 140 TaxID=3064945 RepID=UPI002734AA68|nr:PAS domain-containing protein [Methylobacterium sp. NEAU 140]MDP4027244.1 PAS domain-containing protein [Methylobacterium sp. NEAU 140]